MEGWTFLTNHSHVLLSIATDPEIRLRDVAQKVGITERAAQRIVADLIEGGYLTSTKVGRRNRYTLNPDRRLRHPVEQHCRIASLLSLVTGNGPAVEAAPARGRDDRQLPNGSQKLVGRGLEAAELPSGRNSASSAPQRKHTQLL
jgi:hypothetical protein